MQIRYWLSWVPLLCSVAGLPTHPAMAVTKLWSLQPVVKPEVPTGANPAANPAANPIDAFISAKYKERGLHPVGPADKLTLLRRVYFDLIGIPPTPAEQDAFFQDQSPDAYSKVVDRLLANEQHGVRWARHWLDVLRYADLDGLDGSVMPAASGIYLWRDWVISALNHNVPYDQFVRAQILGSRYKEHTIVSAGGRRAPMEGSPEDQFALGFLARAAITRNDKDRDIAMSAVETISTAFIGMTMGCAKCHDHKFDPIKQTDFYAMKAIFDPLVLRKVTLATPAEIFENGQKIDEYRKKKAPIEEAIELLIAKYREKLYDERVAMLTPDVQAIIRKPEKQRTVAEQKIADDYFPILRIDPPKIKEIMPKEEAAQYTALLKQAAAIRKPPELHSYMTVEEDTALSKEKSYVLTSGDPKRPEADKPVEPGLPFQVEGLDFRKGRREGFVDWLTAPENPLFARVVVNRIWQWHFGQGLQRVPSDFGMLGGKPANQQLLDYLASEFVAHGYDMKWLHRLIVMSNTYQLSSKGYPRHLAMNRKIDPGDNYLWHFRLQRLEAEPIWDEIFYSAGDLDLSVGGKSFQMKFPDEKQSLFVPRGDTFDTRSNRRGIYMARGYIPSTDVMANFLLSFDVDDGRAPCPVRGQTVAAPQALFSMNDKVIQAETAKLAARMLKETSGDVRSAVNLAYRTTLSRLPTPAELDRALTFVDGNPDRMQGLAWLLFNLDEFIYVK